MLLQIVKRFMPLKNRLFNNKVKLFFQRILARLTKWNLLLKSKCNYIKVENYIV